MAIVVKEMVRLLEASTLPNINPMWDITHCVFYLMSYFIKGTSVGEGTFGKVKLGKHILTGEKVNFKSFLNS
jgi:serine/threonine protein kinase